MVFLAFYLYTYEYNGDVLCFLICRNGTSKYYVNKIGNVLAALIFRVEDTASVFYTERGGSFILNVGSCHNPGYHTVKPFCYENLKLLMS